MITKNGLPVVWLRTRGYIAPWLERTFGGRVRLHGHFVLNVMHLPAAIEILRDGMVEDVKMASHELLSMSDLRMDVISCGMRVHADSIAKLYGITKDDLSTYLPVHCPKMVISEDGLLHPWHRAMELTSTNASRLYQILYDSFWNELHGYDEGYSQLHEAYATEEMIAEFCDENDIPEIYIPDLRRQFQRKFGTKRGKKTCAGK